MAMNGAQATGSVLVIRSVAASLILLSHGALAQQPPTAGGQLQQIQPAPTPQRPAPEIRIEQGAPTGTATTDSARITVSTLHIVGETAYPETELLALTGFSPGSELSLADLNAMASKIEARYRKDGYFVARAYLAPQQIANGEVTITVSEGHYGAIKLRNQSSLSDARLNGLLRGLDSGDTIRTAPLEHHLLLLSDLPGVMVKSTLVPGTTPGTSDLIVDVSPGRRISGSVEADNAGNRYTGAVRVGATVHFNNLTGHADVATLRVLSSFDGLKYGLASYQAQFGRATAGIAYSALDYRLGKEFAPLRAHGTAHIASVFGSYPLLRSRNDNLSLVAEYNDKSFRDIVDLTSSRTDRKVHSVVVGVRGDHRDDFGGGGYSAYALTGTFGKLDIRTPLALFIDELTARSNGSYRKLSFNAMRLQRLDDSWSLYAAVNGQLASKNLDISEKMELGGLYAVRAYPEGEAFADDGIVMNLEARWLVPNLHTRLPGQVHLLGFVDVGAVRLNRDPWMAGTNHRSLSGAGVGATWDDFDDFSVRAYYAFKLGNDYALSAPDRSGRFWIQVVKYF